MEQKSEVKKYACKNCGEMKCGYSEKFQKPFELCSECHELEKTGKITKCVNCNEYTEVRPNGSIQDLNKNLDENIDRRKPKKPIKCMTNEEVSAHYKLSNNSRILTNAELKFYQNILSSFCDDLQLIPLMKVRVNDIIDINEADSREDYHYRLNVAMLHFDFVIVKPESTEIVCVIELDDSSHQKEWTNDDDKNKLCQILNIPLLRVSTCPEQNIKCIEIYNSSCTKESKHSSIAVSYANVKAPVCKKCGSEMTETPNKKQGVIYWNCPKCCKENDFSNGSFYIYV